MLFSSYSADKTTGGVGYKEGFSWSSFLTLNAIPKKKRKQLRAPALDAEVSLQLTTQICGFSSWNFNS